MTDNVIEWRGLAKAFTKNGETVQAIENVDVAVPEGEFISIVGPSGCGKSTLLNMTAGLMEPSAGEVLYRGAPVNGVNTRVGYMTQKDALLPWRSVRANVELALEIRRVPRERRRELAREYIQLVGLDGFENHYPRELSGGMRKRASLIRTLIYDPETLLMDEPFGALDAQLKLVLQEQLLHLWGGSGKTIVFVTHDLNEAIVLSDRVIVMTKRPGNIRLISAIDIPRPRDVMGASLDPRTREHASHLWEALRADVKAGEAL